MQAGQNMLRRIKRIPIVARLNWQLYLLRDLWSSKIWTRISATETPFGFTLFTRAHPAYKMMRLGKFEPDETRIFLALMPITDAFIDVGANVGYYCCLALQRAKPVVAFEPQLQNLRCLFQAIEFNGWQDRVEVFPVALSSTPGLLSLFGASGPSASLVQDWAGYSSRFRQVVPVNTMDHVLAGRFAQQQLIVKVDVEGAEFQVLNGALATLTRDPKPIWMMEVCFNEYHPNGVNPNYREIFNMFFGNGYECYSADKDCARVLPADIERWLASGVRDIPSFNYIFADPKIRLQQLMAQVDDGKRSAG